MGCGSFTAKSYSLYNSSIGRSVSKDTGRVVGQTFTARKADASMNPHKIVRECVNNEEHPNTIPVILALDVTGSMGSACKETAETLGVIMTDLYKKFTDIEFCVMGIGDLAYDNAPIQMSQFESDVRIAEAIDKIYMEKGGGGNSYESYTAAWYMGLHHTKLDCHTQGRKGIIITMGDEMMNPYLPATALTEVTGDPLQDNVETKDLYEEASKKFDIFHIGVNSNDNCFRHYKMDIEASFGKLLGKRYKESTIQQLAMTICDCIEESINGTGADTTKSTGEGISW